MKTVNTVQTMTFARPSYGVVKLTVTLCINMESFVSVHFVYATDQPSGVHEKGRHSDTQATTEGSETVFERFVLDGFAVN